MLEGENSSVLVPDLGNETDDAVEVGGTGFWIGRETGDEVEVVVRV